MLDPATADCHLGLRIPSDFLRKLRVELGLLFHAGASQPSALRPRLYRLRVFTFDSVYPRFTGVRRVTAVLPAWN
jgi:hypothetical protein